MLRLILNELKIKKVSFIISLIILLVTITFNLVLQVKFKESFEIKYIQLIYCFFTFAVIWDLNILIACSDVRNKCFIMYRSIPIDSKKFVISRYLTYSIITIIYIFIVWIIGFIASGTNLNTYAINFNAILICISTNLVFIAIQMPIIFKNNEKYLTFIGIAMMFISFSLSQIDNVFNVDIGEKLSNAFIMQSNKYNFNYLMISIILLMISMKISMKIYSKNMKA